MKPMNNKETMKHYGYIYKITINNEESHLNGCTYIGLHKYNGEGLDPKYFGSSARIKKEYIPKYGYKGLIIKGVIWADSKERLLELEKLFILIERKINLNKCLNIASGGDGGDIVSNLSLDKRNEIKQKQRDASLIMWQNPEHKEKLSDIQKNRYKDVNERIKTGESVKNSPHNKERLKKTSEKIKRLKWYNDGEHEIRVLEKPEGKWKEGRLLVNLETKIKMSNSRKGKHRYTNGKVNILLQDTDNIPEDFYPGITFKDKSGPIKGKYHWYNNGEVSLYLEECPDGFVLGRLKKSKIN